MCVDAGNTAAPKGHEVGVGKDSPAPVSLESVTHKDVTNSGYDNSGKPSTLTEVSDLPRAEQLYTDIFQNSPIGIIGVASDATVASVNDSLLTLLGWNREALLNRPLQSLLPPDTHNELSLYIASLKSGEMVGGTQLRTDGKMLHRDGSEVRVQLDVSSLPTANQSIHHVFVTDLSEREAQLKRVNSELAKSNENLERFAYITSHDLKAPLRGITNISHFIDEDMQPLLDGDMANVDLIRDHLQRLQRQTARMEGLIRGILDYSKVERVNNFQEDVDVAQVLSDIGADHQLHMGTQLRLPENLPLINTDRIRLEQVFGNLISNAVKFHPRPHELCVQIACSKQNAFYEFSVKDNGPGIDKEYHAKIFGMFQTLRSKDDFESTGVGLTLAKRIVEQQGGDIGLTSDAGKGTTFTFSWPVQFTENTSTID